MHNGNAPIADFAVSYRLSVSLNKVGDTLTATVEPADAKVTYKWTINGKGAVTTATYTVPADANSGDDKVLENQSEISLDPPKIGCGCINSISVRIIVCRFFIQID